MRYRIKEAIAKYAMDNEGKNIKTELAHELFPNSSLNTRQINMHNLLTGKTKSLDCETLTKICNITGVTPQFLTGWENE